MTKKYDNPPLAEAVFELFYHASKWNPALPGLFYNEIKENYPVIGQNPGGFGFNIGGQGIRIGGGSNEMIRYQNEAKNDIIHLAPNMFTVNRLPKYNNWENFSETINKNVQVFNEIIEPKLISRVGLKVLNKIDLGEERTMTNLKKVFKTYPIIGYPTNDKINSVNYSFEIPIEKHEVCSITIATLVPEPSMKNPVLFQLIYSRLSPIDIQSIGGWLEKAHKILNKAFEENLTDSCKESFNYG